MVVVVVEMKVKGLVVVLVVVGRWRRLWRWRR